MQPGWNSQKINFNNQQNLLSSEQVVNPLKFIKTTVTKKVQNSNPNNGSYPIGSNNNMMSHHNNNQLNINSIISQSKKSINPMEDPRYSRNINPNSMMPQIQSQSNNMFNQNNFSKNSMNSNNFSLNSNSNMNQLLMNQQNQLLNQQLIQQQKMQQNMVKQMQQQMIQNQIMQQQLMKQQMISQQLAQQQMLSKMKSQYMVDNSNSQIEDNFDANIYFKVRDVGYDTDLIRIPIQLDENASCLIEKYREKTNDYGPEKKFIFNAKELDSNLSCIENGLCPNSIVQVINTKNVNGAKYNYKIYQ